MSATFKPEDSRPFNLEHALKGAPFCCTNSNHVQIFKWDCRGSESIAGIVLDGNDFPAIWDAQGICQSPENPYLDLVMKPLGYLDGWPVHVGDELLTNLGVAVKVFPLMSSKFQGEYTWPQHDGKSDIDNDRDDFLSMFSESTIRDVARKIRGKDGANIAVEVVLSVIGETADHRIIQAVDTLKIKGVTPPAVPIDLSQIGDVSQPVPLHDHQQAAIDAMTQSIVDEIMPGHDVVDTSKAPPSQHGGYVLRREVDTNVSEQTKQLEQQAKQVAFLSESNKNLTRYFEEQVSIITAERDKLTAALTVKDDEISIAKENAIVLMKAQSEQSEQMRRRLTNIAAFVRNDATATTYKTLSSYRAAVLSKVLD